VKKTRVVIPKEHYLECNKCGAEMVYTGIEGIEVNSPVFQHRCSYCDHTVVASEKYPYIKYVSV